MNAMHALVSALSQHILWFIQHSHSLLCFCCPFAVTSSSDADTEAIEAYNKILVRMHTRTRICVCIYLSIYLFTTVLRM